MGLFDFLKPKKTKTLWDKVQENPVYQKEKALYDALNKLCADGCEADEISGGYGEFGLDLTNPVPTNTLFGSSYYLAHLLSADGKKIVYEREGSFPSPISSHPVDAYTIFHADGGKLAVLYLSPYHKRTSEKAPRGFILLTRSQSTHVAVGKNH